MLAKLPQASPEARLASPPSSIGELDVVESRFLREHQVAMVARNNTIRFLGAESDDEPILTEMSSKITAEGLLTTYHIQKGDRKFAKSILIPNT